MLGPCTGACEGCERAERGAVEKSTPAREGEDGEVNEIPQEMIIQGEKTDV